MARTKIIPGFRFHPTDIELVNYYLKRKVLRKKLCADVIADLDIYKYQPWDLPDKSLLQIGDLKWYFFCPIGKKYASGARMNRSTESGYWKTTGKDRPIKQNNEVVGLIKTLIFHIGRSPRGERTNWVMHEYRLQDKDLAEQELVKNPYVLCVIFKKDGLGPKINAQYGAPFNEKDWDDDDGEDVCVGTIPSGAPPGEASSNLFAANNESLTASACEIETVEIEISSFPCPSGGEIVPCNDLPSISRSDTITLSGANPDVPVCDAYLFSMLDCYAEDTALLCDVNNAEETDNLAQGRSDEVEPCLDINDIYNGLGDLYEVSQMGKSGFDFLRDHLAAYAMDEARKGDEMPFLELHDLDTPFPKPTGR